MFITNVGNINNDAVRCDSAQFIAKTCGRERDAMAGSNIEVTLFQLVSI